MRDPEFVRQTIEKCEAEKRLQKKQKQKDRLLAGIGILLVLLVLSAIGYVGYQYVQYSNTDQSADTVNTNVTDRSNLDFETYLADYKAGVAEANQKYQGQVYTITAEVTSTDTQVLQALTKESSVLLKKTVNGENLSIVARFTGENRDALKGLKIGSVMTFTGTCSNELSFRDCTVVEISGT